MGRGGIGGELSTIGISNGLYDLNKKIDKLISILEDKQNPKYCRICRHFDELSYCRNRNTLPRNTAAIMVSSTYCCVGFERRKGK